MLKRDRKKVSFLSGTIFLVLGLALFGLLVNFIYHAPFLEIKSVTVTGDTKNIASDKIKKDLLNQNILYFSEESLRADVLKNLLISSLKVQRNLPSQVSVAVLYRNPVAVWQTGSGRFLVSGDGMVYSTPANESLPQVSDASTQLSLGDKLPQATIDTVLGTIESLDKQFTILTLTINGSQMELIVSGNIHVLLDANANLDHERQALQLILAKAKIEGKLPRVIDLRYQNPVVSY